MKKKIVNITYEDIEISEELRKKCIKYLEDNSIKMYHDYRDHLSLEHIEKLMESKDGLADLECEIWDNSVDYICQLEYDLLNEMKQEFSEYKELEEIEISELREEFIDYISVDINIEQLIKNTPAVNIRVVVNSNYEGVGYDLRGDGDFKDCEYIQQIKKLIKNKYEPKSFQVELDNICSCVNQLMFYGKCEVMDLVGIKENFTKEITISKNSLAGFFDTWSGSGSVLEIKLTEDIKLKKQHGNTQYDDISIILDEAHKYSVMEVYGLYNIPEISINVK